MTRHSLLMALGCVAALGGAVVAVIAAPQASQITIPEPAFDVLSAIDSVPQRDQVQRVFGDNALVELQRISMASLDSVDAGVQIRAVRALTHFVEGRATVLLVLARPEVATAQRGTGVVLQRTAIEALAIYRDASDVARVIGFLDAEYSRDVRASAAHALGLMGSPTAVEPLRSRFRVEQSAQVKYEISNSLHILGQ
ncbi:MAG: HEAT repeat domain-containing protein [Kofleriaceae bacterium]|nr:HEAT repeat domain-containing protein [Kofleriaceae bacterium]